MSINQNTFLDMHYSKVEMLSAKNNYDRDGSYNHINLGSVKYELDMLSDNENSVCK